MNIKMIGMENKSGLFLLKQTPNILRVRGYRLYAEGGKRLVDLWLNGGAAVLGHTPPNLLREIKNTASRGLYAPLPHFTEGRFIKALSKLFPGYVYRFYAAPPAELLEKKDLKFWRPYTNPENPFAVNDTPLFIPVLQGIQTWRNWSSADLENELPYGLCVVAAQHKTTQTDENLLEQLPPNDMLPPVLLSIATRGIHDLLAAPQRAKPNLPRIIKALKDKNSIWKRQGIYLTLKEKPAQGEWNTLFNKFLEAGFLLPPTSTHPLILPGELSDGEEAKLAAALTN